MGLLSFMYRQLTFKPKPLPSDINLQGQTIIVTGSNTGLGLEAARELVAHNAGRVILGVRSINKGQQAKEELAQISSKSIIEVWELDSESFESVTQFGQRAQTLDRLDAALLNAGVSKVEWSQSPTQHEASIQVNHLATALLSLTLLPPLKRTSRTTQRPSRLTITTSEVHMWTPFTERNAPNILQEMDKEQTFGNPERYYTSKLLNVLWTRELASAVDRAEVVINMVNPGLCWSSLHRDDDSTFLRLFKNVFAWSAAQGGYCLVNAAITQDASTHGGYLSEQKLTPYVSIPRPPRPLHFSYLFRFSNIR